ncbi:MAG: chorismate-binding protein [Bacteroidetes bacterium]|nr:chorismate-binding protein [Bacteroidota bacterium]MBS1739151.1 chorismate-binding protein [Bacteroidota bacterium]
MYQQIIALAQTFLQKRLPFCLYRMPDNNNISIATLPEYCPTETEKRFIVAPFHRTSQASPIILSLIKTEAITTEYLSKIENIPVGSDYFSSPLPMETSKEQYFEQAGSMIADLQNGKAQKAILSRVLYFVPNKKIDPIAFFLRLCTDYPKAFIHLLAHQQSGVWAGASPELLLESQKQRLVTMALAGTQARNDTHQYHWQQKELEEHFLVCKHIESVAALHHCDFIEKTPTSTVEIAQVAHLVTHYNFMRAAHFNLQNFLNDLHPTPAVGGLPVKEGLACIAAHEEYDRRYYCGYIGEVSENEEAHLFVNLRNMQIGKDKIAIFVGGGLTAASKPEDEWEETVLKSRTMIDKIEA